MTKRVGLLVGREWSFPPAFIDEVNRRAAGVTAEMVSIGGVSMDQACPYDVIVDRISQEVPCYRSYLKQCLLQGVAVVNNPLMWSADDKFFGAALITKLGVVSPRTVVLPNKDYVKGIVPSESLKNLQYPLDWEGIVRHVGLPCVLKDAHGGGWRDVYICHSFEELIRNYDQSGLLTMIVQQFVRFDQFVRCMCLGQEEVLVMGWDPRTKTYHAGENYLAPALRERVVKDSLTIVRALGYDMNTIEFAIQDGVPYAIDFMNPAPDMDIYSLTQPYFDWVVTHMADLVIKLARGGRRQVEQAGWAQLFAATRKA
jgi:glutathione synthase/RimK-type ligase-like ATP-grasp enzyme